LTGGDSCPKKEYVGNKNAFLIGFTLIELIVVITIIAITSGIGLYVLSNINKDWGLTAATNYTTSLLRYARSNAKSNSLPQKVVIDTACRSIYLLSLEPIGLWHFENQVPATGSASTQTTGAFGSQGKIYGANQTIGKIGMAFNFRGTSYIEINDISCLPSKTSNNTPDGFVIELWLCPNENIQGTQQVIFYKGKELVMILDKNGRLEAVIGNLKLVSKNVYLAPKKWVYVILYYDGEEGRLFINDIEADFGFGKIQWVNDMPLIIGAIKNEQTQRGRNGFNGTIDEFKFSILIATGKYTTPPDVGFQIEKTFLDREKKFVIHFDTNGELDKRYHLKPISFKVTSHEEEKTITILPNGIIEK